MRTTKLELSQALQARNAELEAARLRIAELEGDVAALKAKLERVPNWAPREVSRAYEPRQPSPEQLAYREACRRAREMAMAAGRSVVVR